MSAGNKLRLGLIGLSEGNGHPYSWAAIFNGYNPTAMEQCGFPIIPRYLERQRFPEDAIAEARVTHVWAQNRKIAEHLAQATFIGTVTDHYTDMIGQVDAVLLARDDAENHLEFATPFLDVGLPIYIDKPLALGVEEAERLIARQRFPGQLFSCSALRYAREFQLSAPDRQHIGRVRYIHATAPKDWDRYAAHLLEPVLLLADERGGVRRIQIWHEGEVATMALAFANGVQASVSTLGAACAPLALRVCGDRGWKDMIFNDAFFAFKVALSEFVHGIINQDVRIDPQFTLAVVRLIEAGRRR